MHKRSVLFSEREVEIERVTLKQDMVSKNGHLQKQCWLNQVQKVFVIEYFCSMMA